MVAAVEVLATPPYPLSSNPPSNPNFLINGVAVAHLVRVSRTVICKPDGLTCTKLVEWQIRVVGNPTGRRASISKRMVYPSNR